MFRLVHYHIRSSFRFDFRDLIHPTIFYVRLSKAQINYISTSIYWNYTLRIKWISISNAFIQIFVIWLFYFLAVRFCNHCSQLDSGGDDNSNNRPISSQQTEVWCSLFSTSYHSICMNVCKQRTGGLNKCTTWRFLNLCEIFQSNVHTMCCHHFIYLHCLCTFSWKMSIWMFAHLHLFGLWCVAGSLYVIRNMCMQYSTITTLKTSCFLYNADDFN